MRTIDSTSFLRGKTKISLLTTEYLTINALSKDFFSAFHVVLSTSFREMMNKEISSFASIDASFEASFEAGVRNGLDCIKGDI